MIVFKGKKEKMATFGDQGTPPITTQGLITVNADLDPNIVANRQNEAAAAPAGASIIGANAIDAPRLQIEEGELAFASTAGYQFGAKSMSGRRPLVFTSFNGLSVARKRTQEAFESDFIFIGMAQSATFPEGDPGGMGNGIALKRAGSGTTLNNSSETFCPGDVIGYRLPSVDESTRAREVPTTAGSRIGTERYRPGKHTAILRKVTYEEIISQFDVAVAALLDSISGANVPSFDQKAGSGQEVVYGSTRELSVLIKKAYNWAFVSAVITAIDKGLVTPVAGQLGATPALRVENLTKMMGLVPGAFQDESTAVQRDYFLLALNGSLDRTNTENQAAAQLLLETSVGTPAPALPTFGQAGRASGKLPEQIKSVARTASYGLVRTFGRCMNNFERTTIATASCFAAPGNNVDYVLRP